MADDWTREGRRAALPRSDSGPRAEVGDRRPVREPPAPLSAGSERGGVAGDFDFMADTGPYLLLERTVSARKGKGRCQGIWTG
jgi:hypothetical protein